MTKIFEQVREAKKTLSAINPTKVAFVSEARDAYVAEAAKVDDELNFIGNPGAVKLDFMVEAVMNEGIDEEDFNIIWDALDVIATSRIAC